MKDLEKLEAEWSYDSAVEKLKPMVINWAKKTLEVARELYIANKKLSNSGYRSDLISPQMRRGSRELDDLTCAHLSIGSDNLSSLTCVPADKGSNEQPCTFKDFCDAVGIPYSTARRWLVLYDPDKDYLLTTEEYRDERYSIHR